jgi:hypothetical protein
VRKLLLRLNVFFAQVEALTANFMFFPTLCDEMEDPQRAQAEDGRHVSGVPHFRKIWKTETFPQEQGCEMFLMVGSHTSWFVWDSPGFCLGFCNSC